MRSIEVNIAKSILLLLILSALTTCSEVIDLNVETEGGLIVIYGRITNGTEGNTLEVTRTQIAGQQPTPISGAVIKVMDEMGGEGQYHEIEPGLYELEAGTLPGIIGRQYQVDIKLPNGRHLASRPEVMPSISAKDSLYFEVKPIEEMGPEGTAVTRDVVSIFADTDIFDPRPDLFLKWNVHEVYSFKQARLPLHNFPWYSAAVCYMTHNLEQQRVLLYNGSELRASGIFGQTVTNRLLDETFRGKHFFNFTQQSLTEGAYAFWEAVDKNANRNGSIFDQPPGQAPSNLYDVDHSESQVLGYFEVTAIDTARIEITNSIIDRFFDEPCPLNPEVNFARFMCFPCIERYYEPECLNCSLLLNSSYERPGYFD